MNFLIPLEMVEHREESEMSLLIQSFYPHFPSRNSKDSLGSICYF